MNSKDINIFLLCLLFYSYLPYNNNLPGKGNQSSLVPQLYGQESSTSGTFNSIKSKPSIRFKHIKVQDGLSEAWVKSIYQDSHGFLWFGTAEGINKYNGCDFKIYKNNPGDENSLSNNLVNKIFEDSRGFLWVGTQSGINIYDREKDHFIRHPILQQEYINDFTEMHDGRILVAFNSGLSLLEPFNRISNHNPALTSLIEKFPPRTSANDILLDKDGNLWVTSYDGLYLLDTKESKLVCFKLDSQNSTYGNSIYTIYQDKKGRIWLGTFNSGLVLVKFKSDKSEIPEFITFANDPKNDKSISKGAIYTISDDEDGNLWIGTENGGLNSLDIENFNENTYQFKHYNHNPSDHYSISSNSIHSIYEDKEGTLWIGTYGGGVSYYNKVFNKFHHYYHVSNDRKSISNNHINVIFDENDYLWIGTEEGLNLLNKKSGVVEHFKHNPYDETSLGSNAVLAIAADKKNNLWIGTWGGGLNLFDRKTKKFRRFLHKKTDETSLGSNNIFGIMCDSDGDLWIATMGGGLNLYNYDTHSFKRYTTDYLQQNTISDNWVESIIESSYGELWISTTTAIDVFNKETEEFVTFRHDPADLTSINYNGAIVLYEDSRQNIWAGTESGLNLFSREDKTFISYREPDGLPNNTVKGICEDDNGNLWVSTNKGISKFTNGTNRPQNAVFKNYTVVDGLQGNEFNNRAVCKGRDGILYFGGNNGFNAFNPDNMKDNPLIPEVVLTDFLIFNKPVAIDRNDSPLTKHISLCDEIKLGSDHSVFSIEYAALNYFAPNKNQYAFILEGFEKEWNFVGNQRLATYTNLDAGKYIFRVKAANSDGIWSTQDRSVPIIIFPAWWGTSWAYILYLLIAVTLYYMFWRFHLNRTRMKQELILEQQHAEKLEVLNRMKSRFFANIAHEFRTPLTLINGPIRQLIADGPDINFKDKCKMILHNSEKLNHLINQLLELNKLEAGYIPLKARKTDIILIINKINMSFTSLFESKKINFNFTVSDDIIKSLQPPEVYIDPDKFEKIISNLLSNAIKFTPDEGRIEIILKKYADVASNSDRVSNTELMEIIVRDSGPGIPEENIKRIFDRFYQVDNFRSSGYVGTGIGLSLAKELVELHHGTINVESVEGQGTAFIVRLQTGKKHLKPDEIEVSAAEINDQNDLVNSEFIKTQQNNKFANSENGKKSATKNSPLVLIIEDNQEILSYLSDYLGNRYQIIKAASGDEGVNMAVTHIPDLIISDVMMPNTDGYELCDMIKNDERTSHIPVILLTARSSAESRIKGLETGADDYIGKPFDIKELEARVQNLIDQRQQLLKKYNRKAGLKLHEITVTSSDKKFLEKALAVIEKNIGDPGFGVEEFADEMALSRVQLYRKIRALTGQNASTFIRTVRINRAAELLKKKYDNIGQIAFYVGFNSPSYFSKCFYKQFGIYPSNYSS